jgi:hypothetical protein
MLAVDTSGSMVSCTNPSTFQYPNSCPSTATANSCALEPTRLNDAKCAVRKTVQAFSGQVNFGLSTYAQRLANCSAGTVTDSCPQANGACGAPVNAEYYSGKGCTLTNPTNGGTDGCGNGPDCPGASANNALIYNATQYTATSTPPTVGGGSVTMPADNWRNGGNIVVDMLKDTTWNPALQPATNVPELLQWFDGRTDNNREIFAAGSTPLEGMLRTIHQYYSAGWSSSWADGNYCASGGPAINHPSPIEPASDRTCRSLNVILVTDGDEQCGGTPANAAAALYKVGVVIGGVRVPVRTYVIGFAGASAAQLNPIADAGDNGEADGSKTALFANNEVQLAQALSDIISGSVAPETCDNADNNCNGCIDEGSKLYCNRNKTPTSLATLNGSGTKTLAMCCNWTTATERTACTSAYSASITTTKPKGDQWFLPCWDANTDTSNIQTKWLCADPGETCDDKDNNCDVQIDKSQSNFSTNGIDETQNKCGSPAHCPVAESCPPNNQDDDCDGVIDNAPGSGVPFSACPGACQPSPELCNGCDDDCDGIADNGINPIACGFSPPANCAGTRPCTPITVASPGACIPGVTKPGASRFGTCSSTPGSTDVTCDNLDDNCNGVVDEGAPSTPCTNGQPGLVYKDVNPASQCVKGQQACHSTACVGWVGPSPEICDGIDNDCDGLIDATDPDLTGVNLDCGSVQGICTRGKTACVGGAIVCTGGSQPQPEVCDGKDNNCNGQTDEAPLNDGPAPGAGGCWRDAGATCTFQNLSWNFPTGATCSGIGTLTTPCQTGALVCLGAARWACQGGIGPSPEVCDGNDNDCDGKIDTADTSISGVGAVCAPPGTQLGTVCQGTTQCTGGTLTCGGGASPTPEICDGKDNDCDGLVDAADPDLVGIGTTCGSSLGICKTGITACVSGATVCQGEVKPGTEICDGLDNNCDGAIDNNPTDTPAALGCWNVAGNTCSGGGRTWSAPPGATCTGVGSLTSPCSAGSLVCAGTNKWVCQGGTLPSPEICDGADNDCDGTKDDGNPGGGTQCGSAPDVLPCKKGILNCTNGQLACQGEVSPTAELCDGVDNDCDGVPDDHITSGVGASCGSSTGVCKKGVTACVSGSIQCQGSLPAGTEVCNGLDDDCDGQVDNHLTDGPATPGCWQKAGNSCTFKNVSWDPPAGGTCDSPGTLTTPCRTGALVCAGATGWACQGGVLPSPESCDNIDNDCNGQTDNGNPGGGVSCGSSTGACKPGTLQCTSGNLICNGGTPPGPEICDGIDNNCDGQIDEPGNLVGLGQICGSNVGVCKAGVTVCQAGKPVCQGEIKASPEICDGKDNDCNGSIDDKPTDAPPNPGCWNNAGNSCTFAQLAWDPPPGATCNGTGSLSAPCSAGALVCRSGGWECAGGRLPAASEVCDGVDNNCDGTTDNGDPGGGATCGQSSVGVCKLGTVHCIGGQLLCQGEVPPGSELCDGKDNDCNGVIDDNAPGSNVPCTGQCSTGTTSCIGGTLICKTVIQATPEVCDGIDNDCNGLVDDGALGDAPADPGCWGTPGTTCTYGAAPRPVTRWDPPAGATCSGLGTLTSPCTTGRLRCDGAPGWTCIGGKLPTTEICDGQDQNCNGTADDDDPGGGAACGINVGTCTFGTQHCVNGQLTCDGKGKLPELCDGKDNDCNGLVDDGLPLGTACAADYDAKAYPGDRTQGLCEKGKLECDPALTGKFLCRGGKGPQPEVCNGFDDDCDGKIDEPGPAPDGVDGTVDPTDTSATPRRIGDSCGTDTGECEKGKYACESSRVVCANEIKAQPEICDCKDNDCDGQTDEDPGAAQSTDSAVCGSASSCVKDGNNCECATHCRSGEFPCPTGTECKLLPLSTDSTQTENFCVSDACGDCAKKTVAGECGPAGTLDASGLALPLCECANGGCHGPCFSRSCGSGTACVTSGDFAGRCRQNTDCRFFGCPDGKACSAGACVTNPCATNPCKKGEVCKPSPTFDRARCVDSCATANCAATERCVDGACEPTGCTTACKSGEVCTSGQGDAGFSCGPNRCVTSGDPVCIDGSYCDPYTVSCGNDPCAGVVCPSKQVCVRGECATAPTQTGTGGASGAGGSTGAGGSGNGGATSSGGDGGESAGGSTSGGGSAGSDTGGKTSTGGKAAEDTSNEVIGLATGGGGCRCDIPARGMPSGRILALAALAAVALVTRRRARHEGGAR